MKAKKLEKVLNKKLSRRAASALIALALLVNETYIWTILENELDISITENKITAAASEGDPVFTGYENAAEKKISIDIEEFVDYSIDCQNFPEYHQNDKITIKSTDKTDFFQYGFAGLGTEAFPFNGSIAIREGNTIPLNLDAPLFNYVNDTVTLGTSEKPLKISRYYESGYGSDETTPLIAKNVKNGEGSASWYVDVITPSAANTGDLGSFGGFIGTMQSSTELELSVVMNGDTSVSISGSDDLGLACGHMCSNAALSFSIENSRVISEISTTSGDVGSLVGEMESSAQFTYSGTNFLEDKKPISTSGGEYGGYAGGIVGKNTGGTVTLNLPSDTTQYPIEQYVSGTEGAGGIYGYYQPDIALVSTTVHDDENDEDVTVDNSIDTSKYSIDCQVNGTGYTGGLFGMLESSFDVVIKNSDIGEDDPTVKAKHNSGDGNTVFGGLIGQYKANDASKMLKIENVKVTTSKGGTAKYYGGCIGRIDPSIPAYTTFTNVNVSASNANSLTFGGLVASADKAYVKADGVKITANDYKGGGMVGSLENGVLQIHGTNSIVSASGTPGSGDEKKVGKIVGFRDNGLVFIDKGASCTTVDAAVDDIGAWGGVLNLNEFETPADALSVDGNAVTIGTSGYAFTPIGSQEQFAVTALRFQIDGMECTDTVDGETIITGNPFVTFANASLTASEISEEDIELSASVSLAGTGVYGLTRDNDVSTDESMAKCVYKGTFDGGSKTITFDTGKIYRHQYVGLFAKLDNAAPENEGGDPTGGVVKDVTFSGKIAVDARTTMYVGAAAAIATGNFDARGVSISGDLGDNDDPFISYSGSSDLYVGGILGKADGNIGAIDVSDCSFSAKITGSNESAVVGGIIGQINHDTDEDREWEFDTVSLTGVIKNDAEVTDARIGGLVAVIPGCDGNSHHRTLTLKDITTGSATKSFNVSGTGTASMGGLLGYSWIKTDVDLQSVTATSSTVKNSGAGSMAGLVYRATGKWDVTSLTEGLTIDAPSAPSVGMIVNKGISGDDKYDSAIYLRLASGYNYDLSGANVSSVTAGVFDELCAYTAANSTKLLENGNGVISIATTFKTDETNASGSYHAQTEKGVAANPNARYYYNLDTMDNVGAPSDTSNSAKLMMWGLNQYACSNLKQYFPTTFTSTIPNNTYDMTNYSWYPIDLNKNMNVNGTFKFASHEFELSEDAKKAAEDTEDTSLAFDRTNLSQNQHYTMHCGLFRNVASGRTLTVGTAKFQGDVGIINGGSGALVYGKVEGASQTSKATVKINGPVSLDGVYVSGVTSSSVDGKIVWNYAPLLINKVGNYVNLNVSGVSTTGSYSNNQKAASSLIGDVGLSDAPTGITVDFRNMKLDGRTANLAETGTTYNAELDSIYGTSRSIFTRATLLNSFKYASGSTGTYNFKRSDDWAETTIQDPAYPDDPTKTITSYTHIGKGVTYGQELGYDSANYPKTGTVASPKHNSQYPDEEFMYEAESGSTTRTYFTNPIYALDVGTDVNNVLEGAYRANFVSGFLPYVYVHYNTANNEYQLQVNHGPSAATGCGTYDDPYILSSGDKLEAFCYWINTTYNTTVSPPSSGFKTGDTIRVPKTGLSNSGITGTWCGGNDVALVFDGTNFKDANSTYSISPLTMRTYLAGAYYQIPDIASITVDDKDKFTGLGNTTDEYAKFRGIIDGNGRTIINQTGYPLIASSNGSVVKDVTITVQPTDGISLSNPDNVEFLGNDSKCKAYGAVIGKVFGGDNIIDNVSVSFGKEATSDVEAEPAVISLTGTYAQLAPVGAYVGVVINGGLYFRNMARLDNEGNPITYGENLFINVTFSTTTSDTQPYKANNKKWLYVNPIIGRVINGFAVTESGVSTNGGVSYTEAPAYRPFEDGTRQYPDKTDDTDETWPTGHVTMQNSAKNYSITDINPLLADFTMMKDGVASGAEGATVTVSNAQQLFIISLITEAGLGTSSNCKYDNTHNRLKPYGENRATHIAHYTKIGAEGLTSADSDYQIAKNDVQTSEDYTTKIPHIIKEYTPSKSATEYPAFDLAAFEANENELYLDMVFSNESGSDEEYMMPDGFRGLGALLLGEAYWTINADGTSGTTGNDDANYRWLLNTMNVNSLTGNDRIVSLNMNLELYSDDNYNFPGNSTDANLKTGFGFFNALRSNYDSEAENKIQGLTIKGTVNYDTISKSTGEHLEISAQNTYVRPAVGGFIGAPGVDTNKDGGGGDMWLEDITLDNLSVSGVLYAGGMIGCSNVGTTGKIKTYTFINCSADNLEVTGGTSAGGMIGYIRNSSSNTYCDFGGKEFGVISIVSRANWGGDTNGYTAVGALFGDNYSGQNAEGSGVTVKNVTIRNAASTGKGYVGYSTVSNNTDKVRAGGLVGIVSRTSRMTIEDVIVKNLDIKGLHSGGMIGFINNTAIPVNISNCRVETDKGAVIENIDGTSGGIIGTWQSTTAHDITISTTEVKGYTIKGAANCGGIAGRKLIANTMNLQNVKTDGVSILTNSNGGGLVGEMNNGNLYGYNILVNNLSFNRYSGTGNVASWGEIAGYNNNKPIKLAGFSRQDKRTGDNNTMISALVGSKVNNSSDYGSGGYVIFADYDGKAGTGKYVAGEENYNKFSNVLTEGENVSERIAIGSKISVTDYTIIAQRDANGNVTIVSANGVKNDELSDESGEAPPDSRATEGHPYNYSEGTRLRYIPAINESQVNTAANLIRDLDGNGFYIKTINTANGWSGNDGFLTNHITDTVVKTMKANSSYTKAVWYFEAASDNSGYYMYTFDDDNTTRLYIAYDKKESNSIHHVKSSGRSDAYCFNIIGNETNQTTIHFKNLTDSLYLGRSNGKKGVRLSPDFGMDQHFNVYYAPRSEKYVSESYTSTSFDPSVGSVMNGTCSNQSVITELEYKTPIEGIEGIDNTNKDYEVYNLRQTIIENIYENADNWPYVTSSPYGFISGEQYLTGDAVGSTAYLSTAFRHIVTDQRDADAKAYTACPTQLGLAENADALTKLRAELSNSYTEYRSYISSNANSGIRNFPLLVAENTVSSELHTLINNYLQTLTNTNYNYAVDVDGVYSVKRYKYVWNGITFAKSDEAACLKTKDSKFAMDASYVDTQDTPQFTLMDIQFYDPSGSGKIAYHLYVPVYVKKVLRFDFNAEIKSGTDYAWDAYGKIGDLRNQGLFENLGNPVTIAFEWRYTRSASEWADSINGGDSVLTNYYKSVYLKNNIGNGWAAGTRMVLIDVNNKDKAYYLDVPPTVNDTNLHTFELYSFTEDGAASDDASKHYKPVDLNDLMKVTVEQMGDGTLTSTNADDPRATVRAVKIVNDEEVAGYYRPITDDDTELQPEARFSVKSVSDIQPERYYLTIFTKASTANNVYHYEMYSPDSFGSEHMADASKHRANKINDSNSNTILHFFTGKLYENDLSLNVVPKQQTASDPQLMSETNDYLTITMTANIRLTSTAIATSNNINGNMRDFIGKATIYQTFLMMYDKLESGNNTSSVGIEQRADGMVGSRKYYWKGGAVSGELNNVQLIPDNVNDYGATEIDDAENLISDQYIELRNNLDLVDKLSDDSIDNSVTLQLRYNMVYNASDLSWQFPKKAIDNENIGSYVIGYSRIASTAESASYSATSTKRTDSNRYYTADESTAKLTYNVVEAQRNAVGPYKSLGINPVEMDDDTMFVDTYAVYDIQELKDPGDYIEITFDLTKRSQLYGTRLPIETYLSNLKIYGKDSDSNGEDDVIFTQGADDVTKQDVVTKDEGNIYRVRVHKDLLKQTDGLYIIPIKFNVKTGDTLFNNDGLEYSNYKATVTAKVYSTIDDIEGSGPSAADPDHIIYTNAKVLTSVVE